MSINVTVTGNPVSIKRGKLITTDLNHASKEFQNRRRMRLEQVRQQSKDIAESVRNKVRKEKSKQLTDFEKKSSAKLDEIKARKLLDLQNQYQECLQDIGLAHTQAKLDEAEELEILEEYEQLNKERSKERGLIAKEKQQIITNEKNLKRAIPIQTKKMAREIENTRSTMVSNVSKSPKKKREQTRNVSCDSDICEIVDILDDTEISDTYSSREPKKNARRRSSSLSPTRDYGTDSGRSAAQDKGRRLKFNQQDNEMRKSRSSSPRGSSNKSPRRKSTEKKSSLERSHETPKDTRISDRIKSRQSSQPPRIHTEEIIIEDITDEGIHKHTTNTRSIHNDYIPRPNTATQSTINSGMRQTMGTCSCSHRDNPNVCKSNHANDNYHINSFPSGSCHMAPQTCDVGVQKGESDVPSKPTVSIRNNNAYQVNDKKEYHKVQQYDHNNRFSSNYIIDNTNVQRIPEENIEVCVDDRSEGVFPERIFHREKMAEKRGREALGKTKIQKEYEVLMKKLPVLQKHERMAMLDPEKDKFHMSEKRLDEQERIRQQKLESAFEKLVPKTITIPKKKHIEMRPNASKANENIVNNSTWKNNTTDSDNDNLRSLLEKLKSQKELLMKESEVLPDNSNLNKIISDMEASEKSRDRKLSPKKKPFKAKDKSKLQRSSSSQLSVPSPRRKHKTRRDVLVLQNMSTQTSPKILKCTESNTSTKIDEVPCKEVVRKDGDINMCECNDTDQLCEILIKIQGNEKPEILIASPKKNKDVVVNDAKKPKLTPTNTEEVRLKLSPDKKRKSKKKEVNIKVKDIPFKPAINISNLWRDQLSRNDLTNSSTSYYSPPDYSRTVDSTNNSNLSHLLHKPQQQSNINYTRSRSNKTIDPRLLTYIKKLLVMSKGSVDDLGASTVSEISTPGSSIINMESNRPENKLMNVLKFFNLNLEDVMHNLNNSQDTTKTNSSVRNSKNSSGCESSGYNASQSHTMATTLKTNNESTINKSKDARQLSLQDYTQINYPDIANKYSELADVCQKRINNLAAMIDKVRSEKQQMLSPTNSNNSDKENLTSYLNLPSHLGEDSSTSPEQVKLTHKLLEIDKSAQSDNVLKSIINNRDRSTSHDLDPDILDRYLKLLTSESTSPKNNQQSKNANPFVPVLLDIPKLPKLAVQINESQYAPGCKRPPPSKGLNVARKFIADINVYPHELSTIPEGDSMRRSKSPEVLSQRSSPKKGYRVDGTSGIMNEVRPDIIQLIENIRLTLPEPDSSSSKSNKSSKSRNTSNKNSPQHNAGSHSPHTYNVNSDKSRDKSPITFTITPNDNISPRIANIPSPQKGIMKSPKYEISKSPQPGTSINPQERDNKSPQYGTNKNVQSGNSKSPQLVINISPQPGTSKSTVDCVGQCIKKSSTIQVAEIISKLQEISTDTSSEKSELDIETMLKTMGMGWAVSTVRKTQEALARQSSSTSSFDNTSKNSETSDISLKGYLTKELIKSSSTAKSDASISPFLKEFQDISAIQGSDGSIDKQQRTSTPVQTTRSSNKSKNNSIRDKIFTAESDLSSVQGKGSADANFVSLPDFTENSTME